MFTPENGTVGKSDVDLVPCERDLTKNVQVEFFNCSIPPPCSTDTQNPKTLIPPIVSQGNSIQDFMMDTFQLPDVSEG